MRIAPRAFRLLALPLTLLLGVTAPGCSLDLTPATTNCLPGDSKRCVCTDGTIGIQICSAGGATWSPCGACGSKPLGSDASVPRSDGPGIQQTPGDGGSDGTPIDPDATTAPDTVDPNGPTPISIVAAELSRYTAELGPHGPIWPYGWVSNPVIQQGRYDKEIQSITSLPASAPKWLIYSCHSDAKAKLSDPSHLQQLKQAGVYAIGLNSEADKTCGSEFQNMTQTVVDFAALAKAKGLTSIWGPIRSRLDSTSDSAYTQMFNAGLGGIALQEQNALGPRGCVPERISALKSLSARLDKLAGRHIELHVQIMARQCGTAQSMCGGGGGTYGVCHDFVKQLHGVVDTIGIWTIGEKDTIVAFIKALRAP